MISLVRQNASTTIEIRNAYQQYVQDERLMRAFKTHFNSEAGHEHVESFFRTMLRMYGRETMEQFADNHTYEIIQNFSDMKDIWNAWYVL